jgi:isoamylase
LIEHLLNLQVTAIEFLPLQTFLHDFRLLRQGLRNYWGYQPIQYFTLMRDYFASQDCCVDEWQSSVDLLHKHGIEVILDVVYNHTGEGDHLGPTFSFRGLDQSLYYATDSQGFLMDSSGCGNRLNLSEPLVQRLVMDSLRFWTTEMGVDGFRFDLCSALGRNNQNQNLDLKNGLFSMIAQDPILQQVKLIAEPWDLGENGYALGQFPTQWSEWNDQFRNSIRKFWKGDPDQKRAMATALCGSSQIFDAKKRPPRASIQAICTHDGFCLEDLVCYRQKHNWANLEDNRDGPDHHDSDHYGVEGFTDDPKILAIRRKQKMNLIATWAISKGTLMILGGDEMGRSQRGNNNAYCQDHELSYLDWEKFEADHDRMAFYAFCCKMMTFRKKIGIFGNGKWLYGKDLRGGLEGMKDVTWLNCEGEELRNWDDLEEEDLLIACFWEGESDRGIYVAMNRSRERGRWLRVPKMGREWQVWLDTGDKLRDEFDQNRYWLSEMSLLILVYTEID